MKAKRRRLVGAMCPICRTVEDWSGAHIYRAAIFCRGDREVGFHDIATVTPVSAWVAR